MRQNLCGYEIAGTGLQNTAAVGKMCAVSLISSLDAAGLGASLSSSSSCRRLSQRCAHSACVVAPLVRGYNKEMDMTTIRVSAAEEGSR